MMADLYYVLVYLYMHAFFANIFQFIFQKLILIYVQENNIRGKNFRRL